ncbi:hypothetical protein FCV25MIE_23978, partial [Fagus crenata]
DLEQAMPNLKKLEIRSCQRLKISASFHYSTVLWGILQAMEKNKQKCLEMMFHSTVWLTIHE